MLPSILFWRCGFFDEAYASEAQDVDLCLKAQRLGGTCHLLQAGAIQHLENATRPRGEQNLRDRARFVRKWARFHRAILS